MRFPIPSFSKDQVEQIRQWAEVGAFRPVQDRIMSFEEIPVAHRYAEGGMKIGNVVISVP